MTAYRKKPVVIEAVQFKPTMQSGDTSTPDLLAHLEGCIGWLMNSDGIAIPTLEGTMTAVPGDWIIKGVKGEFYPCKPDIFEATYEPADSLSSPTPADEEIRQAVEAVCAAGYDVGDAILGEESTAASHRAADAKLHLLSLIERRVQQGCQPKKIRWVSEPDCLSEESGYVGERKFFSIAEGHRAITDKKWMMKCVTLGLFQTSDSPDELKRLAESKLRDFIQSITESAGTVPQRERQRAESGNGSSTAEFSDSAPNPAAPSSGTRSKVEAEQDAKDARLWRGLMNSGRIRVLGHAENGTEHMHLGVELWVKYPISPATAGLRGLQPIAQKENRELLTVFAEQCALHSERTLTASTGGEQSND